MQSLFNKKFVIGEKYHENNDLTLYLGDCMDLLKQIPDNSAQLVVTSPPYNIGKEYEKRQKLQSYLDFQEQVIKECYRILKPEGSICWQTGNYVDNGSIIPLDIVIYPIFNKLGMKMRNRIVWYFGHGLHASRRFSGRYETIVWFTKTDNYFFNLDPVRIPQKYPAKKHFKGDRRGELSCNPLGKNPADVWDIPNVKSNHTEKTEHPCQFPVALIERLVLSMTQESNLVFDPFMGVGTTAVASLLHNRKSAGADIEQKYLDIAKKRVSLLSYGQLKTRPMNQPIYKPKQNNQQSLFVEFGDDVRLALIN